MARPPAAAAGGTQLASVDAYTALTLLVVSPFLYNFWQYNVAISNEYREEMASDLYETWLTPLTGGRMMDLKDPQWKSFRSALPVLCLAFSAMMLVRTLAKHKCTEQQQHVVGAGMGLAWMFLLHRVDAVFLLVVFAVNYALIVRGSSSSVGGGREASSSPHHHHHLGMSRTRVWQVAVWGVNLALLFAVKKYGDFLHPRLLRPTGDDGPQLLPFFFNSPWIDGTWLAAKESMFPWWITFNLMFLRLVSLSEDSSSSSSSSNDNVARQSPPSIALAIYYLCYPPLYIAGPIIRFHDFANQVRGLQPAPRAADMAYYFARFAVMLLTFELFSSYVYCSAMAMNLHRGNIHVRINTLEDIKTTAYWSLATLFSTWLKFALIWRFARLVSLADGITPPENMRGCIASTINFRVFWKEWHSSFNQWLVRYMYIPLGGSRRGPVMQALASIVCFLFVAAWHDLEPRMAVWGLGICAALVPEIIGHALAEQSPLALHVQRHYPLAWDAFAALFGGLAVMGLVLVNMLGFSLHEATWVLLQMLHETPGAYVFLVQWAAWMSLFAFFKLGKRRREAAAAVAAASGKAL